MTNCPCCSNQMLRHIRLHETYWFCRHCWQKMPNLSSEENQNILNIKGVFALIAAEPLTYVEPLAILP